VDGNKMSENGGEKFQLRRREKKENFWRPTLKSGLQNEPSILSLRQSRL